VKKIIISLLVIVVTVGLVAGGTIADFSDIETSQDNYFQTAGMDLKVSDGETGIEYDDPNVPQIYGIEGGWPSCYKEACFDLHNAGSNEQIPPLVYLHLKNIECDNVEPKIAYKKIICTADGCVEDDAGRPVTEPEFVAECGGIAGEDRNGNFIEVTGIGCGFGEYCELSKHVDINIQLAGPYPMTIQEPYDVDGDTVIEEGETRDVVVDPAVCAEVPAGDWMPLDLSQYDTSPQDGIIKMNEIVSQQILLGPLPGCNTIYVKVYIHLQDIDEDIIDIMDNDLDGLIDEEGDVADGIDDDGDTLVDEDLIGQVGIVYDNDGDGLVDEDPTDGNDNDGDTLVDEDPAGYFDDSGENYEYKWDHWPTNALMYDIMLFDMSFELLQDLGDGSAYDQ
jgi:predicted ribosomally synthesized peptide with SipW-like signal peptide